MALRGRAFQQRDQHSKDLEVRAWLAHCRLSKEARRPEQSEAGPSWWLSYGGRADDMRTSGFALSDAGDLAGS